STARTPSDLEKALAILNQVAHQALPSGVLSEQMDPATGQHVSVSPLTWSHSTYVAAVQNYLRKSRDLAN
ncbi:MAG: glycoside hydrolase family 15 protein, partial [Acidobacteriota bacterium]